MIFDDKHDKLRCYLTLMTVYGCHDKQKIEKYSHKAIQLNFSFLHEMVNILE